jgi:hypothetical protein
MRSHESDIDKRGMRRTASYFSSTFCSTSRSLVRHPHELKVEADGSDEFDADQSTFSDGNVT